MYLSLLLAVARHRKLWKPKSCAFHCSSIGFLKQIWPELWHGTIYISMSTGFPVENSCLNANPWVAFSNQSPLWLRPSQLLCQLWWESNYANMAERLSTVERKVETLSVEGTGSVQLERLMEGSPGLAMTFAGGAHWRRTVKLYVMFRAQYLQSSWKVGKYPLNQPVCNSSLCRGIPIQFCLPPKHSLGWNLHWFLTKANRN